MFERSASSAPTESRPDQHVLLRRAIEAGVGIEALALLDSIDPAHLDAYDRVDFLKAWVAHDGWLALRRAEATVAVAGPLPLASGRVSGDPRVIDEESVTAEVAAALRVSEVTASTTIATARALAGPLSLAAEALRTGLWGFGHLRAAESELLDVSPEVSRRVLEAVLKHARSDTPARLRYRIRREVARIDSTAVRRRIHNASRRRRADLTSLPDLQGELRIIGPWAMTAFCHRVADTWAQREMRCLLGDPEQSTRDCDADPGGAASVSALRADAYVAAMSLLARNLDCYDEARELGSPSVTAATTVTATDALKGVAGDEGAQLTAKSSDERGSRRRSWSEAIVMIPLVTALALSDEPGHVPGYGPVPAAVARELLSTADTWRRFLIDDDSGQLVNFGRTRYRPSARLREYVTARDQQCAFPGCSRASTDPDVDLDHRTNFDGINTTPQNLQPLCRRHHRLKTHGRWVVSATEDAPTPMWTTPAGHQHAGVPPPLWEAPARAPAQRSAA